MTRTPPRRAAVDPVPGPAVPPGPSAPPVPGGPGTQDRETGPVPAGRSSLPGSALGTSEPGDPSLLLLSQTPTEAAAGRPDPVTGARLPDRVRAPGRGRTPDPAGGELDADGALSAGSMAIAKAMSEDRGPDSLDAHVRRYFKDLGLFAFHAHDARRSEKGYPDWTICGPGGQLWRELKTQRGKLTREQQAWLDVLAAGGADAGVWRPEHLYSGQIANELVAVAGLRAATA